jgi:hypothetical protein
MQTRTAQYIFLSRVNAEFGATDRAIGRSLGVETSPHAVAHQTGFAGLQDGLGLLHKLLDRIRMADAVVHYVGQQLGAVADANDVADLLRLEPAMHDWLVKRDLPIYTWTYTQWEAYMAIYLRACERDADAPLSLICYRIRRRGCEPDAAVTAHCSELRRWQKGLAELDLPGFAVDDEAGLALFLAEEFRNSTIRWPPRREDRLAPDEQRELVALLKQFVERGLLSCGEIAVLAFPLCRKILGLQISRLQVRNFIANLVDHVNDCRHKDGLAAVWVYVHVIRTLVATRNVPAAAELRRFLDSALARSGCDPAAVANDYERIYPDCFPNYPLNLCVEVFVQKVADRTFGVSVSYRVGHYRQFVVENTHGGNGMDCVDDPRKAIDLAVVRTAETVGRLGGPERIELMLDGAMLDTDEAWRWLATARWQDHATDPTEGEPDPIVLRWPHTEKSAALVERIAADSTISLREDSPCAGARVVRGDPVVSRLEKWKISLKTSTLTLWERGATPLPNDAEPFHWNDAPRQVQQRQWQHVGVALNPPDALVYSPPGKAASRYGPRIQQHLR